MLLQHPPTSSVKTSFIFIETFWLLLTLQRNTYSEPRRSRDRVGWPASFFFGSCLFPLLLFFFFSIWDLHDFIEDMFNCESETKLSMAKRALITRVQFEAGVFSVGVDISSWTIVEKGRERNANIGRKAIVKKFKILKHLTSVSIIMQTYLLIPLQQHFCNVKNWLTGWTYLGWLNCEKYADSSSSDPEWFLLVTSPPPAGALTPLELILPLSSLLGSTTAAQPVLFAVVVAAAAATAAVGTCGLSWRLSDFTHVSSFRRLHNKN